MAIKVKKTTVSTTAVAITSADTDITSKGFVTLKNNSADKTCYIGPSNVTTSTGFALPAGASLSNIELKNNEVLYGICGTGDEAPIAALQVQY